MNKPRIKTRFVGDNCAGGHRDEPIAQIAQVAIVEESKELLHDRVQFLINYLDKSGLLDEHRFTFPGGDTWGAKE